MLLLIIFYSRIVNFVVRIPNLVFIGEIYNVKKQSKFLLGINMVRSLLSCFHVDKDIS